MFVRSRGVWFGFAENMFTFCSAKSRKHVFSGDDSWRLSSFFKLIFIYEHWLVITASWEDLAAVVFVSNKFMSCVQYAVLSLRLKVINLNILPESSRNELKYSLKIAFMFLSIILKFQVPNFEKRRPFSMVLGPRMWYLVCVSGKQHEKNVYFMYFFFFSWCN